MIRENLNVEGVSKRSVRHTPHAMGQFFVWVPYSAFGFPYRVALIACSRSNSVATHR